MNEWMNEWMIYIVLYCVLLYTQSTLQSYGGGGICTHNNNNKDNYTNNYISVHTNGQLIFIVYCKHTM